MRALPRRALAAGLALAALLALGPSSLRAGAEAAPGRDTTLDTHLDMGLHTTLELPDVAWERLEDGPDLALHTMILDPVNDMLWVFGGVTADVCGADFHNEVWRYPLGAAEPRWESVRVDGLRPPPLIFHSAVYDPLRQEMLVYGGLVQQTSCGQGDTSDPKNVWRLSLADPEDVAWTRDSVAGNLAARAAHAAVYVPAYDAMVVSGGDNGRGQLRDDAWALLLGEAPRRWVRLANAGFAERQGHALIVDEPGERILAYGGLDRSGRALSVLDALDISGELDGADVWTRLRPSNPSPPRSFFAHAYDAQRGLWWMQGGALAANRFLRDLQVLDLSSDEPAWTNTQTVQNGPLERFFHPGVWDAARGRMIVQGGTPDNNRTLRDTRAMVYQNPPPPPTASPTLTPIGPTSTPTPTRTPPIGPSPSPTSTPTPPTGSPSPTATATPADVTPTATDTATPPNGTPTAPPTATPSRTPTMAPGPIYLPLTMRDARLDPPATEEPTAPAAGTATPTPTATEAGPRLEIRSAYGGDLTHVAAREGIAYASVGLSLLVLDVSAPASPTLLGRVDGLPSQVRGLAASDALLAVGLDAETRIYDLSDPGAPVLVGSARTVAAPSALGLAGSLLIGYSGGRLRFVDVSRPTQPVELSELETDPVRGIAGAGTRAFLASESGLTVVDVGTGVTPEIVGALDLGFRALDVTLDGDLAALALDREGIALVDISDPTAPRLRARADTEGRALGVALAEDALWVADSFAYRTLDVADPAAPEPIASGAPLGSALGIRAQGGTMLAVDGAGGLALFDAGDPETLDGLDALGRQDVPGRATGLTADGDLALSTHIFDALRVYDASAPLAPREVAELPAYSRADGLALAGGLAYVGEGAFLTVLDLSDPARPQELGALDGFSAADAVAVAGDRAYVADLFNGLHVVDVSDPSAPARLGQLELAEGRATGLAVDAARDLVFVAAEDAGVLVVDVADPAAPALRASFATSGGARALALEGTRLFAGVAQGLEEIDAADPDALASLAVRDARGLAYAVGLRDGRAWLGHGGGVSVYDVSQAGAPTLLAERRPGARIFGVAARGDTALASSDAGLLALELVLP